MNYISILLIFLTLNAISQNDEMPEIFVEDDNYLVKPKESRINGNAYRLELNGKFGIRKNGKIIIPIVYDELPVYFSEIMIVKKDGMAGVITNENKVLIDFKHKIIKETNFNNVIVAGSENSDGKMIFGVYSLKGKLLVDFKYRDCNENFYYELWEKYRYSCTCENGEEQFFDDNGNLKTTLPGQLVVKLSDNYYKLRTTNYEFGVVDTDLNMIVDTSKKEIFWIYQERYFCFIEDDGVRMNRIYDMSDKKLIYETKGILRKPNKDGKVIHEVSYTEELNIDDLIKK